MTTTYTITCQMCSFPCRFDHEVRTYDAAKCPACDSPLTLQSDPVDVLNRIGEWRRNQAREILAQQWESYLLGERGSFAEHIARALRLADASNAAKIREAWPMIYTAWEFRDCEADNGWPAWRLGLLGCTHGVRADTRTVLRGGVAMIQITIKLRLGGSADVDASIYGALAVHRTHMGKGWTVTHIETGHVVGKFSRQASAIKFCEAVKDESWDRVKLGKRGTPIGLQALDAEQIRKQRSMCGGW